MAQREAEKAATLADDLTAFVRPRETVRSEIDSESLVEEVLAANPPAPGVEVVRRVEPLSLFADGGQMAEVLTNLVTNAYQARADGGTVIVAVSRETSGIRLVVEDSGPGVDEAVADRLFEPFFTTKSKGTGLGLAIVQRLVAAHDGEISCESPSGGGARFTVLLPREPEVVSS